MTFTLIPNRNLTVVTKDNQVLTITKDNPHWPAIMDALRQNDEDALLFG
jgi:hypothetical protein